MTHGAEREISIDAVRGFAVLGILLMNIVGMGMPATAYIDPSYFGGDTGADLWTWAVNYVLSDGKMRGLFTMLFGASTVLITERAEGGRLGAGATHYRRMLWLLPFGFIHAYFFWFGDILVCYAIAGLVIFPFRKVNGFRLIVFGVFALVFMFALMAGAIAWVAMLREAAAAPGASADILALWREVAAELEPGAEEAARQITAFRGDFLSALCMRAELALLDQTAGLILFLPEAIGQMLIGMGLYKLGFFSLRWSTRSYLVVIAIGYVVAAPATAWMAWRTIESGFDPLVLQTNMALSAAPRPFIALAHASVILLAVRASAAQWIIQRLAAAGRMALSNYLGTSIITSFVFGGYGLGLYGQLSRVELLFVVVAIWALILIWSRPWLAHFRYGPFEWGWRSLVQWRAQPMRNAPP